MKKLLAGILVASFLFCASFIIADDSAVSVKKRSTNRYYSKEVVWFNAYDVGGSTGTAYDYNESQEADDSAGLVDCTGYNAGKTIQIDVATCGSTSIDVRVEGRAGNTAEWGELTTINFTAVTGANNARIFSLFEWVEEVRVGVKANGTPGTDVVTVTGYFVGEYR